MKDALLIDCRQPAEKRQHQGVEVALVLQARHGLANIAFGGHENEDVAPVEGARSLFERINRGHRLIDVVDVAFIL